MNKDTIKQIVESYFDLSISRNTRKRPYVEARAIYFKLCREFTNFSLEQIGKSVNRDHASVLHGIKSIDTWVEVDKRMNNNMRILKNKIIKVSVNTDFNYSLGYNNMNDARVEPDSVYVSGPESILNNLEFVETEIIKKQNLSDDFELVVSIQNIQSIISIKPNKVTFNESIRKFTEQQFDVFINIINKPDSIIIKLFPEKVSIVSLFPFDLIENVKSNDFEFIFDYNTTENGKFESVPVKLINSPKFSRNVRWEPKTISYLIKK